VDLNGLDQNVRCGLETAPGSAGECWGVVACELLDAAGRRAVSGPALYRYFASRDDLLTELVIDAYNDLADALTAATSEVSSHDPRPRFEALARAYRSWALAQPRHPGIDPATALSAVLVWSRLHGIVSL
jgi:AcrR family transcriptional regulator